MMQKKHVYYPFLLLMTLLLSAGSIRAQELTLTDSATVSLLTVSAGDEIYSHYGHTAIRVQDPVRKFDLVFNYGLFDFNSPNFLYRFVKGETDYLCGVASFSDFIIEYQLYNRAVVEQVLNLKKAEKEQIWQALVKNIQPENQSYRYNFFFNNCSTKPRDIIQKHLEGDLTYAWTPPFKTLREEIHFYTAQHPWAQFGIDFLIGAEADKKASLSDQQFAPSILEASFAHAFVKEDTASNRPLVLETRQTVSIDPKMVEPPYSGPTPVVVFWILFVLIAGLTMYESYKGIHLYAVTAVLYGIFGLTGSLIAFMVLFSEHPATHQNYLLLWQNPFHLIFAIGMIFGCFRSKIMLPYLKINLILQTIAIVGIFIFPQKLHPAMVPLLLMLFYRSILGTKKALRLKKNYE